MVETIPTAQGNEDTVNPLDFVYGAEEIARFLGITVRQVYYLTKLGKEGKGHIPISKHPGFGLYSNRKALVDYLNGQRQV